jgi:RHS repeat-associated protein
LQRSSGIEARHHLLSPDGLIAIESHLGTQKRVEYLHHDHLGSVDTVTNASAQVLQRYAYDAFGARRGASWGTGYSSFNFLVRFGFTGHAMIDAVGLIHMNGRVFDPKLARFISADPFVQFPHHTQAHNRYSYLLNNPLNATDPSGFFLKKLGRWLKKNLRTLVAVAITAIAPYASAAFGVWGAMATGFAAGLVGSGGDLKAGLIGALAAGAFYGITNSPLGGAKFGTLAHGGKVVAHGLTGGIAAKASGGEFRHGFLSAGASAFAAPWIHENVTPGNHALQITAAAVVGGTASELGGGKFGNGAVVAAFSYAFNQLSSGAARRAQRSALAERSAREAAEAEKWTLRATSAFGSNELTIDAGQQIRIDRVSTTPGIDGVRISADVYPLDENGTIMPVHGPIGPYPGEVGGHVGFNMTASRTLDAGFVGPGGNRWIIKIPAQAVNHGNSSGVIINVYSRKD